VTELPSRFREFGDVKPRAIVLDDHPGALKMTALRLRRHGFNVVTVTTVEEFLDKWHPGIFDAIIADWALGDESGDSVLAQVRERDWDVPFVLISGKLAEDDKRAAVLRRLLESGGARFVARGNDGIEQACRDVESLVERRDLALLKVVLSLRKAAVADLSIPTSNGTRPVRTMLAELLKSPGSSHDASRPIAQAVQKKINVKQQ